MQYWFGRGEVHVGDTRGNAGGFLVVYDDEALYSIYDSVGHDDLLRDLAARRRLDKTEVLEKGIRLFFKFAYSGVVISGVREIDNDAVERNLNYYGRIIRRALD